MYGYGVCWLVKSFDVSSICGVGLPREYIINIATNMFWLGSYFCGSAVLARSSVAPGGGLSAGKNAG